MGNANGVATGDYLGMFLHEIGRVPLLTIDEEIRLTRIVRSYLDSLEPDAAPVEPPPEYVAARQHLIAANMRLVVSIAKKYRVGGDMAMLDKIQEGALGLNQALDNFNPALGYKLSTYASWWIRQAVGRSIANKGRTIRLPIHIHDKVRHMRVYVRDHTQATGRSPTTAEIAEKLEIEPQRVLDLARYDQGPISADIMIGSEEDTSLLSLMEADPSQTPEADLARLSQKEEVVALMGRLSDREQMVVALRFGLYGEEPLTLDMIGRRMNITRERVRQLQERAFKKMRRGGKNEKTDALFCPIPDV
jgi:RNA polymerase primary sigma factor